MENFGLWTFAVLVIGLAVMVDGQEEETAPMNKVHDTASKQMHDLKTLNKGDVCDLTFKNNLYGIISEIENNHNATQDKADELKKKFNDALAAQPDKKLCKVRMTCNSAGTCDGPESGPGHELDASGSGSKAGATTADSTRVNPAYGPVTFIVNVLLATLFVLVCSD